MKGVILCGGKSTRLHHKLWLCRKDTGMNIVVAAGQTLGYAKFVGMDMIFCVNEWDHALHDLIKRQFTTARLHADNHRGLSVLTDLSKEDDLVVLCGDNVYGMTTVECINECSREFTYPMAAVNPSKPDPVHLDAYHKGQGRWVLRSHDLINAISLTTPWFFPRGTEIRDNIVETLNVIGAVPHVVDDREWYDLGTPEKVKEYYGC